MKKILAFNASPRSNANSAALLEAFLNGARQGDEKVEFTQVDTETADIVPCRGCLRCNLLKRCIVRKDAWPELSEKILASDILVFATPIYFHHTTASCKKIIDRFRSFVHVQITETGLIHTPHQVWSKDIVLLAAMGSSSDEDAKPLINLLSYMKEILGPQNNLHVITATRLAMAGQISFPAEKLKVWYEKLGIPVDLADGDARINTRKLSEASELGKKLSTI